MIIGPSILVNFIKIANFSTNETLFCLALYISYIIVIVIVDR